MKSFKENSQHQRGFAIIVTVSILVLLAVIAVGLLTLSTVTVRSAQQGDASAIARANARLALALAIGELQKHAGPDQRITARADLVDEAGPNSQITGVWSSWEIKATQPPSPSDFEKAARDSKFLGWLVSKANPGTSNTVDFIKTATSEPELLWGEGTLGTSPAASSQVRGAKVEIDTAKLGGAYAYAVLDEGVKARVNTAYQDNATTDGAKTASLGAGERPGLEFIAGLENLQRSFFKLGSNEYASVEKGITPLNNRMVAESLAPGTQETFQKLTHDVTTESVGIFTDVARGGLKEDFQLMTSDGTLPSELAGKGPYVTNLGMTTNTAPSDPRWESFHDLANIYHEDLSKSANGPLLTATTPDGWEGAVKLGRRGRNPTIREEAPPGLTLLPTLAKVQVLYSLIGRDLYNYAGPGVASPVPESAGNMHNPQAGHFRGTKYDYDLHLMYTPIVTVHNPYNVSLKFDDLKVEFVGAPLAMQVFRNGIPQSSGLVPVETMYHDNENGQLGRKVYGLNLKTPSRRGRPGAATFTLLPGEVKVFSPYVNPQRTYQNEFQGRQNWDYHFQDEKTELLDSVPGWRGDGLGFSCDWLAGAQKIDGNKENGRWASCIGIAADDQFHVEFAPLSASGVENKFMIKMSGKAGDDTVLSAIEIDYETTTGLQEALLGPGGTLRWPSSGTVRGLDLVDHSSTALRDIANVKPFALVSVQAKTTHGLANGSVEDGHLATKPWAFAHSVVTGASSKTSQHLANYSHEFDLQALETGTSNLVQIDSQDRGNFVSGHSSFNGSKFGVLYDIPLAPVQTLASLNSANPGGATKFLPRFAHPIGNSWAHPVLSPDKFIQSSDDGNQLDHSFLLNLAFYDRYYFSGLAPQTGPYGSGKTTAALAADFEAGIPLDDPRLILHQPGGQSDASFADEVAKDSAYTEVAAWQMMEGAFNVNSTSVAAWKAMLASVHDINALVIEIDKSGESANLTQLPATDKDEVRISRLRLPAATSAADGADPQDGFWLGPRELNETELQTLAENIVKQIRLRGPFLSMADFVNRRLGSEDDEKAQRGALQQAIDDSNLNTSLAVGASAGFDIAKASVNGYNYGNPTAGSGPSYQGAPGYITQADILTVLGNAATPRSDTFTVRGYGEARDGTGKKIASATCEAVVQRVPEWIDPSDVVGSDIVALTSTANKNFGRRFVVTSIRWLGQNEL